MNKKCLTGIITRKDERGLSCSIKMGFKSTFEKSDIEATDSDTFWINSTMVFEAVVCSDITTVQYTIQYILYTRLPV